MIARKELRPGLASDTLARARFAREASLTAQLQHPGIVPVHDFAEDAQGALWFTMKEVRGRTLADVIEEVHAHSTGGAWQPTASGWTFDRLVDAFARVCEAMAYAHASGVVHRDLKPENVMVGEFGEVLVLDWGLARRIAEPEGAPDQDADGRTGAEPEPASARLTAAGKVMGTPSFMSPEQAGGRQHLLDARSDAFSLGAILHVLLLGALPFPGATSVEVLARVLGVVETPPTPIPSRVPPELVAVMRRALMRDRHARYPDAGALGADVRAWQGGLRVGAHAYRTSELFARWVRRHRGAVAVGTVAVVMLVVGGAAAWHRTATERDRAVVAEHRAATGEATAREDLRAYLVEQARVALLDRMPTEAALYGAHALTLGEDPEARGAVMAASNVWVPTLLWQGWPEPRCASIALSPDGARLLCTGADGVSVWDIDTGALSRMETNHAFKSAAFDPTGMLLALGGGDAEANFLRVVRWPSGEPAWTAPAPFVPTALAWTADGRSIDGAAYEASIARWTGAAAPHVPDFGDYPTGVLATGLDDLRATAEAAGIIVRDGTLRVRTRIEVAGSRDIDGMAISADGRRLAYVRGDMDAAVHLVDVASATSTGELRGHHGGVYDVAWSSSLGNVLLTSGEDGTVAIWDTFQNALVNRVRLLDDGILEIAWGAGNRRLVTSGDDGSVRVWATAAQDEAQEAADHSRIVALALDPTGQWQASCSLAGKTRVTDRRGHVLRTYTRDGPECGGIAITAEGLCRAFIAGVGLVECSTDERVPGDATAMAGRDDRAFWTSASSPDGTLLAMAGHDGAPRLDMVDTETGGILFTARSVAGLQRLAFSGRGDTLVGVKSDGRIERWDARTGVPGATLQLDGGSPLDVAVNADGTRIAVGAEDGFAYLLDGATGGTLRSFGPNPVKVHSVALSPDESLLAAKGAAEGADDGVAIWEIASGRLLAHLYAGHGTPVILRFHPDGTRLVSAHADGTLRTWDLADLRAPAAELQARWLQRLGMRFEGARMVVDRSWVR